MQHVLVPIISEIINDSPENIAVSPVAAAPGAAQTTELIDETLGNIVVSTVAAAPGVAQIIEPI